MGPSRSDVGGLIGLLLLLAFLWGRGRGTWYWTDEGLSLGIASQPLGQFHDALVQDTAAPLYHLILHGWLRLFGSSEPSTHTLSLLFALAAVPAALWAGWSLVDRRTGWMCAALAALSPYLATYSNETRMYSLAALLSLLATATFFHVFVHRRRRLLPAFSVLSALAAYTHYWGLFLVLAACAALPLCWLHATDRRQVTIDAVLGVGGVAVLFAPWVPTLAYQRAHSAVAWALPPTLEAVRDDVLGLLGGPSAAVALAVGGGAAVVFMLRRPWTPSSVLVGCSLVMVLVVVAAGWATSRASSQWHLRYLGVALGPLLLVLGSALARGGDLAVAMLAVVAILTGPLGLKVPLHAKSNVKGLVEAAAPSLAARDLVFAPMGDIPVFAVYLPEGLRYVTTTGPVSDPRVADWRDAMERLRANDAVADVATLVDSLPAGGHVLASCPPADGSDLEGLPDLIELEVRRCLDVEQHLLSRPDLRLERRLLPPSGSASSRKGQLLTKRAA